MKIFKNTTKQVSLFLSFMILFASCTQSNDSVKETNAEIYTGKQMFESIYFGTGKFAKNIHQLEKLSEISIGATENDKIKLHEKITTLIEKIDETDPSFFNNFEKKVSSGNHVLVQEAIQEGAFIMKKNIEIIFPGFKKVMNQVRKDVNSGKLRFDKKEEIIAYEKEMSKKFNEKEYDVLLKKNMITNEESEGEELVACSWAVACAVYFAIAVHNTVGVTALIYFKVAFWGPSIAEKVEFPPTIERDDEKDLVTEVLIDELVEFSEMRPRP